jgi:penicillin-binding protein 1A
MADRDSPWQRGGRNVEDLPDPFAAPLFGGAPTARRRRWWQRKERPSVQEAPANSLFGHDEPPVRDWQPGFDPEFQESSTTAAPLPTRRPWLRWSLTGLAALTLVTLFWLIFTAPLGRALEPLPSPAMLIVSSEGRPIARRGAIKEAPVEVAKLKPYTPAAFVGASIRAPLPGRSSPTSAPAACGRAARP